MIANLPSKRGSRRVINFNDDDIKTRSQATIHSVSPSPLFFKTAFSFSTSGNNFSLLSHAVPYVTEKVDKGTTLEVYYTSLVSF
jgi:hypothetical protein